jgi:creatinine amidohydrolase
MKKLLFISITIICSLITMAQTPSAGLPFKMEELTSPQFINAVEKAGGVCIIPLGIIEKHGPHLPLGTDLFEVRELASAAAKKEYALVFPPYYFGQIFEARHQPGTMAYNHELVWKMLEETCSELSRNGVKKIILANGHGGNTSFLQYFCQVQLESRKDYIVVLFDPGSDPVLDKEIRSMQKAKLDGHAGEEETSMMYVIRPDLVDLNAIKSQSGLDQDKLKALPYGYTGIWWYASYPNHFASDVAEPNKKLGELLIEKDARQLAELVKYLKANNTIEELYNEFQRRADNPLVK